MITKHFAALAQLTEALALLKAMSEKPAGFYNLLNQTDHCLPFFASLIPPAMAKQGKELRKALKRFENELRKGVQLDVSAYTSKPFVLPS